MDASVKCLCFKAYMTLVFITSTRNLEVSCVKNFNVVSFIPQMLYHSVLHTCHLPIVTAMCVEEVETPILNVPLKMQNVLELC